jgi:hypothetical protein
LVIVTSAIRMGVKPLGIVVSPTKEINLCTDGANTAESHRIRQIGQRFPNSVMGLLGEPVAISIGKGSCVVDSSPAIQFLGYESAEESLSSHTGEFR